MKSLKFNCYFWGLIIILTLAFFLRFIDLSWGLPYHFHPDEWNMASAITRLSWKNKLDPEFYAYGQLPLYLTYFSTKLYNLVPWITLKEIDLPEAIFFLRFWSALAGVGTVYLVYLISKRLFSTRYLSLIAALLASFTPGLIQISHFGTTESLLSLFFLAILYFSFKILEKQKFIYFFWAGIILGLALGTKISALVFFFPLVVTSTISFFRTKKKIKIFGLFLIALIISSCLTLLTSPYLILKFQESLRIITYEARVAQGLQSVFYTRQFFNTTPVLFQLQKIFPYALGWPIFIIGILGFVLMFFVITKSLVKRERKAFLNTYFLPAGRHGLILTSFLVYFLSQAFLFTKWTRFMAPVFAFFPIFAAFFLSYLRNLRYLRYLFVFLAILPGIIFSTIYFRPDIRFIASEWIYNNIPSGSKVLSETGNVIDIPLPRQSNTYNLSPVSFDFYHLDENPELFNQLLVYLETSDYIFVLSRRIFSNHQRLATQFPKTAKYYELLFSGKLGFTETKVFRPFPQFQIFPLTDGIPPTAVTNFKFQINDEQSEETFTVFDHPAIRIYEKSNPLTKKQYEELFN